MQIFVKWVDGKSRTLDVESSDTIAEVKDKLKAKLQDEGGQVPAGVRLVYQGRSLDDNRTLDDLRVRDESTLMGMPYVVEKVVDDDVVTQLRNDLGSAINDFGPREFIFIGIGSYDNNHGKASIKRQQCPDALIQFCFKNQWDLTIFLIDPGFKPEESSSFPQVYDLGEQGWLAKPSFTANGGKVRVYKNQFATRIDPESEKYAQHDMRVITYATGLPEYDLVNSINDRKKVAKLPIFDLFGAKGVKGACVVSGNFYGDPPDQSQYCTWGAPQDLVDAGFKPNP